MRHDHQPNERCDGCQDWPRYAIELAIQLQHLEDLAMTQSDDITTQTAAINADTDATNRAAAILADVKTAVDNLRGAVDPSIIAGLDSAVAGEGAAASALTTEVGTLAADVNVDQPAPAPEPTPAPADPVTTNDVPVDPNAPAPTA